MKNILVIGATSSIAQAYLEQVANKEKQLFLVARDKDKLNAVKNNLSIKNEANIATFVLDVNNHDKFDDMLNLSKSFLDHINIILIAHGTLPDQEKCNSNINLARQEFNTNATSTILLCQKVGNLLEKQKSGLLAVITSVSGDRGRQGNYIYGAAKGAVNIFLQGLRNRLTKSGVSVLTVKPGFVDTPMTAHLPKNLLFSKPEKIANGIVRAINKNKSKEIYLPRYWRIIMFIIKSIPGKIFNKLSL
jgi:short-subunit dehydrogenase